jgi:hypothetical protein
MVARCFRLMRFAIVLLMAFLVCGCATYPAFDDPDIDYNGRWDMQDGGYGAYNPAVSMYDETPDFWYGGTVYGGYYYHFQSGDDPHRYGGP